MDKESTRYPRISRPVELLRNSYDVVVIGSGYGGGVAASRMARGRQSVCVLERGRERWPGEYPSKAKEVLKEFHISGDLNPETNKTFALDGGNRNGLYHLILGQGQSAVVVNGLGGGSLLNANVFLRTDERVLQLDAWPDELRQPGSLEEYYTRAEKVLEPVPYPVSSPELKKLSMLEKQAHAVGLGKQFYRVPLTTRFADGPNSVGVEMKASTLTGQDSTGINDGSKTTTLVTYLSDAWNWGAEMFCECEVRYIKKHPKEGYQVFFTWHGSKRSRFEDNFKYDLMWVHAKKFVFLAAGALGSTEIMLRSKQLGLPISDRVGTNMSGNGDVLAFGYNLNAQVNPIGREHPPSHLPVGPTITGVIDCRNQENVLDGFVLQEGTAPAALAYGIDSMLETHHGAWPPLYATAVQKAQRLLARLGSFFLGPYYPHGSVQRTQIYLLMSHDMNQAVLTLKNDKPSLEFLGVGRTEHRQGLSTFMAKLSHAMGGTFLENFLHARFNNQELTVHPIGGMNISSDGTANGGATTHLGEVFTGSGSEVHDGLVVVDGALVPTALGVNPFATITALAERCVEGIALKRGIDIDYKTRNGVLNIFSHPSRPAMTALDSHFSQTEEVVSSALWSKSEGISFTEVMKGYIHIGNDIDDFEVASNYARSECADARFFLSVRSWDLEKTITQSDHQAMLTGTFSNGMPGSPFMVLQGGIKIFNQDNDKPEQSNLTYEFDMVGVNGDVIHFQGKKFINSSMAFSLTKSWDATATLYVNLTRLDGTLVGKGILKIDPLDFPKQLRTFTAYGHSKGARIQSQLKFISFFLTQSNLFFYALFRKLQWPGPSTIQDFRKAGPGQTIPILASDGVESILRLWEPTAQPTPGAPTFDLLFIPGASVDHEIFALPTIRTNAIEYFTAAGYRCWCVTHRLGKSPAADGNFTAMDARLDVRAAMEAIRKSRGRSAPQRLYVIAHCVGSIALGMGLLDGTIPASWIRGITVSSVFLHPELNNINTFKARAPTAKLYSILAGNYFPCSSTPQDTLIQRLLNQVLRFYPVGSNSELCSSVVCHRGSLAFGRLWSHRNLNESTHTQLHRFFGGVGMTAVTHLGRMGLAEKLLDASFNNLVTEENLERLRGIPILLFSGTANVVFTPESTLTSYTVLRMQLNEGDYERLEFAGYGHLDPWMGEGGADRGGIFEQIRKRVDEIHAAGGPGLRRGG